MFSQLPNDCNNNNANEITKEINFPISHCRKLTTTKPQPNGSNILIKNEKSIMVFIPSSSPLHDSEKPFKPIKSTINSLVIASVKSKDNLQISPLVDTMSTDLSCKSLLNLRNKKSNKLTTMKRSSTSSNDPDNEEESLYFIQPPLKTPRLTSAFHDRDVPLGDDPTSEILQLETFNYITNEIRSEPMTYSRKIYIKMHRIGTNILIEGINAKSVMFFIPISESIDHSLSPTISNELNSNSQSSSKDDSERKFPFSLSDELPIDLSITSAFNSRINCYDRMKRLSTYSMCSNLDEKSMYDVPENNEFQLSSNDLPILPNKPQQSQIHGYFDYSPGIEQPGEYKMYIVPDKILAKIDLREYVDCSQICDKLLILLTEIFQCGDHPDFKIYKRDTCDQFIKEKGEKIEHLQIVPKMKRKPKVSEEKYDCKDINLSANKKIKLEITDPNEYKMISTGDIILGPNGTTITSKQFAEIKWQSVSAATRKLLIILFSNEILATHSLTGKPSPAFIGRERPVKQKLNQAIVEDITFMVKLQTNGTEREIRAAIATKCADSVKSIKKQQKRSIMADRSLLNSD